MIAHDKSIAAAEAQAITRRAHARASRPNIHAIGGSAPEDTDGRLSIAAGRLNALGYMMEAVAHHAEDVEPPPADMFGYLGGMLRELAENVAIANDLAIAQDWEAKD